MKLLVTCFSDLEDVMMCLPFIKGLQDLFPQSDITLASYQKFEKISKIAPYIHYFLPDDSREAFYKKEAKLFEYDQIIDIDRLLTGAMDRDLAAFLKSKITDENVSDYEHRIEMLLKYLPRTVRRTHLHLQESLSGYEKSKNILKEDFDLVIYPFEKNKNTKSNVYNLNQFLSYFNQMNPEKKVLLIGFRHQLESLNQILDCKTLNTSIQTAVVDIESCLSLIKKAKYFIVGNSPLKYLASQSSATVFDIHSTLDSLRKNGIYKDQSYSLYLNEKPLQKIVYREDEFVFENSAHFLSYFVTSVMDNDYEKMLLLTEGYQVQSKIYKTSLSHAYGWRCVPLFWNKESFKEFLAYNSLRFTNFEKDITIFENVYDHIMEDSDYSYDRVFYETSEYLNQIIHLREILSKDSTFGIFLKLQNLEEQSSYKKIIQIMADYLNFDIHQQKEVLKIEELQRRLPRVRTQLKDIQKFLTQFKIYASQKILESFDSTSDLRI